MNLLFVYAIMQGLSVLGINSRELTAACGFQLNTDGSICLIESTLIYYRLMSYKSLVVTISNVINIQFQWTSNALQQANIYVQIHCYAYYIVIMHLMYYIIFIIAGMLLNNYAFQYLKKTSLFKEDVISCNAMKSFLLVCHKGL